MKLSSVWTIAILSSILIFDGCSVKKDSFLTAQDGMNFILPAQGIPQQPLYPASTLNSSFSAAQFISRPRPQPSFIGKPPNDYIEERARQAADRVQNLRLGYNTLGESSLYIHPYEPRDRRALIDALSQHQFEQQEESIFIRQQGKEALIATLYIYPHSVLLSLTKSDNPEVEFSLLDHIRRSLEVL